MDIFVIYIIGNIVAKNYVNILLVFTANPPLQITLHCFMKSFISLTHLVAELPH